MLRMMSILCHLKSFKNQNIYIYIYVLLLYKILFYLVNKDLSMMVLLLMFVENVFDDLLQLMHVLINYTVHPFVVVNLLLSVLSEEYLLHYLLTELLMMIMLLPIINRCINISVIYLNLLVLIKRLNR